MRYAYPIDNQTCECNDAYGMICSARCTDIPMDDYEIAYSGAYDGSSVRRASCGSYGQKISHCSLKPFLIHGQRSPQTNVDYDSEGCLCSDSNGVLCTAVCSANIKHHEVVKVEGSGSVLSSCTEPGNVILGCMVQLNVVMEVSTWPYAYAMDDQTCECFAGISITCIALCGFLFRM